MKGVEGDEGTYYNFEDDSGESVRKVWKCVLTLPLTHSIAGAEPPSGSTFKKPLIVGNAASHVFENTCNAVRVVARGGKGGGCGREEAEKETVRLSGHGRREGKDEAREQGKGQRKQANAELEERKKERLHLHTAKR